MNAIAHWHGCGGCKQPYICCNPECSTLGPVVTKDLTGKVEPLADPPTPFLVCQRCYLVTLKRHRAAAARKRAAVLKKDRMYEEV